MIATEKVDLNKPHYTAVQPYRRNKEFFSLQDFRMKEVLTNHYQIIEQHQDRFNIQTIYSIGMSEVDYLQIVDFKPQDLDLFHEFSNDIEKANAPFIQWENVVFGIAELKDYPAIFGVKSLEEEVAPEIRHKFEEREGAWIPKEDITKEDMKIEEEFLREKGYPGPVWEYPIDKYGLSAFQEKVKPKKTRYSQWPRLVSVAYISRPNEWWAQPDHVRAQIVMQHKVLLKKYIKHFDRRTVQLLGTADYQTVSIFEYPFENLQLFHQMMNDLMKIDSPFLFIEKAYTGITGIGDYWLEQLADVELKAVPLSRQEKGRWGYRA